ncbi:phage tail tape measure protein [Oceanospirillum beijerinckii]|uniref:phage tail tape measure protein n=1 Tax=Oceanospirillum beijerinckii TaxID=64976 RepID=UPI0003F61D86|nr:phage tail tape measure protein [Oceanospirillum beijerinckii]
MSATRYNLMLVGVNKMSPAIKGAAADAKSLTDVLREQRQEAKKLNATQKSLAEYAGLRKNLAATLSDFRKNRQALKGLATEKELAEGKVKSLALEKSKLTRKLKRLSDEMEGGAYNAAELSEEYALVRKQADALGDQLESERANVKRLGAAFDEASQKSDDFKNSIDKQRQSLNRLEDELQDAGIDTGNLAREQARLEREVDASNQALATQKDRLKTLSAARSRMAAADTRMADAQSDAAGTAAMLATAVIPVARAVTMEAAMADVTKVVDFNEGEDKAFQSHLQRLAVEVNIPPEQLTQIASAAGQSGIKKEDLAGFTGAAARMGVAFDMEAAEAGETMAAWRAGMGLNQQQAEQLADAVNHVSNNMNAKARDISGVLKRQGAVATASGMTETQTASLAGALLAGGASEEVAATTLKNLLGALTKGEAATSSQKTALADLGLDSGALAFDMQTDAVGTVKEVFAALADAPVEKQSALISQIFGEESKGGIMPLLKNQQLLQQAFELTSEKSEYENSALEEYENRASVSEHRLGSAWRALDRLGIVLGDSILPVVAPVADGVAWVAGGLADVAEAGGLVTTGVTGLAAAYVGYKTVMFGWQLASAKVEQWRAQSALKTAEKESKLADATDETADKASLATRALERFNRALGRTASIDPGGSDGQRDSDRKRGGATERDLPDGRDSRDGHDSRGHRDSDPDRRGQKDTEPDKKPGQYDDSGERKDTRKPRRKRGRLAGLAVKGWAAAKDLGHLALEQLAGGLAGPASMNSFAGGRGADQRSTSRSDRQHTSERHRATESHLSSDRTSQFHTESRHAYSSAEATKTRNESSNSTESSNSIESDRHTESESEHTSVFRRAVDWLKPLAGLGAGAAAMLVAPEAVADTLDAAGDFTGMATDILGALSGSAGDLLGMAGKVIRPLDTVIQSGNLVSAVASGDEMEAAAAVGDMAGGWGGAAGGAAAGAAIGSIVPVIGTGIGAAIGAGLGGWFGGDAGSWAATKVMEWFRSDSKNETHNATNQTLIADQSSSSTAESSAESTQTNTVSHLNTELKTALKTELRDTPLKQQLAEADEQAGSVITGSALQQINSEIDQSSREVSVAGSGQQNIQFSPQITINAPPGANAEQVAELAVQKIKALFNTHLMPALSPTLGGRIDDSMEIMS